MVGVMVGSGHMGSAVMTMHIAVCTSKPVEIIVVDDKKIVPSDASELCRGISIVHEPLVLTLHRLEDFPMSFYEKRKGYERPYTFHR